MRMRAELLRGIAVPGFLMLVLGMAGCDNDGTGPDEEVRLTISMVVPTPGGAVSGDPVGPFASSLAQDDGTHSLVLNRVALVAREIKLKRLSDDDCDVLSGEDHDACEAFTADPMLLELPLDGSVVQVVAGDVPPDVYDEFEIEVHKPEDDGSPKDVQFLLQHPEFKGVSIRVEGTFDNEAFLFLQDLNEERELNLSPPLDVEPGFGDVHLTLEIDVASWFLGGGNALLDPRTANKGGVSEDQVEQNIRASIRAFGDDDRNGRRD